MSHSFGTRWEKGDEPSLSDKIKETVRQPSPLKPRLDSATKRIENQVHRLDQASDRFNDRDKTIFSQIVDAYSRHDSAHANIYATELAQIRKMEKITLNSKLALEQIVLRISTVTELGDMAATLLPVISVLRDLRIGISMVSPQMGKELGEIGNILSGIVVDAGAVTGLGVNFESTNEDSQKILEEAATIAEQRMKDTFPPLPGKTPIGEPIKDKTL